MQTVIMASAQHFTRGRAALPIITQPDLVAVPAVDRGREARDNAGRGAGVARAQVAAADASRSSLGVLPDSEDHVHREPDQHARWPSPGFGRHKYDYCEDRGP